MKKQPLVLGHRLDMDDYLEMFSVKDKVSHLKRLSNIRVPTEFISPAYVCCEGLEKARKLSLREFKPSDIVTARADHKKMVYIEAVANKLQKIFVGCEE